MLKNYIITAINNQLKNKLYSSINLIGLAVGITSCILITLYVQNELSYDRQWEKADLIYRINNAERDSMTSAMLLPALKKYFPDDIKFGTRIQRPGLITDSGVRSGMFQIGDKRYPAQLPALVDEEFVNIFQCDVLRGSLEETLTAPGNIAINEELAAKYFGDKSPIGEILTFIPDYGDKQQYKVTAVYRFICPNTALNISSFSLLLETNSVLFNWRSSSVKTYIRISETTDINKFVKGLPNFIDKNVPASDVVPLEPGQKVSDTKRFSLQKISNIYFNPLHPDQPSKTGNKTVIAIFVIISILVLIIACINYVIFNTAKATQRNKEIAMRKVVGARFRQLFFQFLGESMLMSLLAFLLALAMTEVALPFYEHIVDLPLKVPYTSFSSYLFFLLLLICVGLLGGLYPAILLSRPSPTSALKANQATEKDGYFKLKNILVAFQFTASITLIISTAVAFFQLYYTNKNDLGFNPNNLLVVEGINRSFIFNSKNTLQEELIKLPEIDNATLSTNRPGFGTSAFLTFRKKIEDATHPIDYYRINEMYVDYNFFQTCEISLISGRYFKHGKDKEESINSRYLGNKSKNNQIIINLEAARHFGYASADEAVGKILEAASPFGDPAVSSHSQYKIIGVVADSQYRSLRKKREPEAYHLSPASAEFLIVRYHGYYGTAVKRVKQVWNNVVGDAPFISRNLKQYLAVTFSREEQENRVLMTFALLAIFIACMGLFGMSAYTVERRVKEIGLRKVMGAKVKDIVKLLGWQFLRPILIADIIAWPIAIFAMQSWLERFPYRFNTLYMIPICLISGFIALLIAWFTVAGNTKRVAKSKPIKALRYE